VEKLVVNKLADRQVQSPVASADDKRAEQRGADGARDARWRNRGRRRHGSGHYRPLIIACRRARAPRSATTSTAPRHPNGGGARRRKASHSSAETSLTKRYPRRNSVFIKSRAEAPIGSSFLRSRLTTTSMARSVAGRCRP